MRPHKPFTYRELYSFRRLPDTARWNMLQGFAHRGVTEVLRRSGGYLSKACRDEIAYKLIEAMREAKR